MLKFRTTSQQVETTTLQLFNYLYTYANGANYTGSAFTLGAVTVVHYGLAKVMNLPSFYFCLGKRAFRCSDKDANNLRHGIEIVIVNHHNPVVLPLYRTLIGVKVVLRKRNSRRGRLRRYDD
jgi:hypothetical protein